MSDNDKKSDADRRSEPVSLFGLTVGQSAILEENDCFGSTSNVVVLKIHKGGNVIVQDGVLKREVSARNLSPATSDPDGARPHGGDIQYGKRK